MDKETIDEVALHLLKTIALEVGKVNIRDLTDHFTQLLADLRKKFNSSKEIKGLLMRYPETFVVKKELVNKFPERGLHGFAGAFPMRAASPHINVEIDDDEAGETEDDDEDAEEEENEQISGNAKVPIEGKGKIAKKFEKYAFIEYSVSNYSTFIFFDVRTFENGQHENLGGLKFKEEVYFHAKPSVGHSAPYRATKVWRSGSYLSQRDMGKCYSSSTSIASQDSFQSDDLDVTPEAAKLTANYGLNRARKKTQGNDSLYPSKREPPTLEKAKNVDDFLEIEDFVYFSSIKFGRQNTAEGVKISETPKNPGKRRNKRKNKKTFESMPNADCSGHTFGFNVSESDDRSSHSSKSDGMERVVNTLYNQVGKIYDLAGNEPVINFGRNEKAIVPPNMIYKNGKPVGDLGWELDEGTEVQFDAKRDGGNWRAVLVWIGDRPQVVSEKSYQKNNTHSKGDMLHGFDNVSLQDEELSGGIRRYRSSPHLEANSPNNPLDESLRSSKNRPKGAKPPKAENYPKIPGGDNSRKKFTRYRKNNNIADSTSSAERGYSGYHQ